MKLYTIEKFVDRVLENMGVLAVGETALASDVKLVKETLDQVQEMADWECLFTWFNSDGIPADKFLPVRDLVSNELSVSYSLPPVKRQELRGLAARAITVLRRQYEESEQRPAEVEYL